MNFSVMPNFGLNWKILKKICQTRNVQIVFLIIMFGCYALTPFLAQVGRHITLGPEKPNIRVGNW